MFCRFNLHFWGEISVDKSSYRFNLHSWWDEISIVSRKKESVRSSHEVSIFGYFRRDLWFSHGICHIFSKSPWCVSSKKYHRVTGDADRPSVRGAALVEAMGGVWWPKNLWKKAKFPSFFVSLPEGHIEWYIHIYIYTGYIMIWCKLDFPINN